MSTFGETGASLQATAADDRLQGLDPTSADRTDGQQLIRRPALPPPPGAPDVLVSDREAGESTVANRPRLPRLLPNPAADGAVNCNLKTDATGVGGSLTAEGTKRRRPQCPMQRKLVRDFGIPEDLLCTFPVATPPTPRHDRHLPEAKRAKRSKKEGVSCLRCWHDKKKVCLDDAVHSTRL